MKTVTRHPSPVTRARYLRDARAIAAAWGAAVYNQRGQRKRQLEPVHTALDRPDFPPKAKRGWPKDEMVAWGKRFVVVNGRDITLREQPINPELPIQAHPANGELFSSQTPEQKLNGRLDLLEDKYFNPNKYPENKIAQWEVNELRQHRPWLWARENSQTDETGTTIYPRQCSGAPALCRWYQLRFKDYNIKIRPQYINNWQKGEHLPRNATPHPAYDTAGRYTLDQCFEWFEQWQLPKYKRARTPDLPGVADSEGATIEDLRDQDEREEIEYRKWERARDRSEYIHKTVALATGVAAVKKIHLLVKGDDERNLPRQRRDKLCALGVAPTILAQFESWDIELARAITDRREQAMAAMGAEPVLEKELNVKAKG